MEKAEELKVIENELVPVYRTSAGEKVVYGTELYAVLEVKSNYRDWVRNRLNDCEAIENEDFQIFAKFLAKGRPRRNTSLNWTPPKKWRCWSAMRRANRYADISSRWRKNTKRTFCRNCPQN